jgi:hypothetical protein
VHWITVIAMRALLCCCRACKAVSEFDRESERNEVDRRGVNA